MTDRNYVEKRDFIRMKVNTPAKVCIDEAGTTTDGVCNDLSGNGMSLTINQQLPLDTELLVTLSSEHGNSPKLQARCTISRLQESAEDKCLLGLEILEILSDQPENAEH